MTKFNDEYFIDEEFIKLELAKLKIFHSGAGGDNYDAYRNLKIFEPLTLQWWNRIEKDVKPTLDHYRRETTRSAIYGGSVIGKDILKAYPPSTGKLYLRRNGTEWHRGGLNKVEIQEFFKGHEIPPAFKKRLKK